MILVTGATGLLGNAVVRELRTRDSEVRVLIRSTSDRRAFDGLEIEFCEGDVCDVESLRRAIQNCCAVVHCAAFIHIGWTRLEESWAVNVGGTRNVIEACVAAGCRLVHVSTVDTLPAARSAYCPIAETSHGRAKVRCAYVVSKTEAEQCVVAAIAKGLDAIIVHPGFMLGPFDWKPSSGRMMLELARTRIVVAPGGGVSVCDVRDVAAAIANALENWQTGESFILAGWNIRYWRLWTKMLWGMGRRLPSLCFPIAVAMYGKIIDQLYKNREGERSPNGAEIAMGGLLNYYDSSKAVRMLDYRNRPLDETLCDAWQWLCQHHPSPPGNRTQVSESTGAGK